MKGVRSTFSESSILIDPWAAGASDPPGRARFHQAATQSTHPDFHARFRTTHRRIAATNRLPVLLFANLQTVRETFESPVPDPGERGRGTALAIAACRAQRE